jgi:hypothetical protein
MEKELQDQITAKYPKLFAQKDLPPTKSLMCFGMEVGDGWYNIIDTTCKVIQDYLDSNPSVSQAEFVQVKEKFGGLRMYARGGDDYTQGVISIAESLSFKTCERCGNPGKQTNAGWIFTLCQSCKKIEKRE